MSWMVRESKERCFSHHQIDNRNCKVLHFRKDNYSFVLHFEQLAEEPTSDLYRRLLKAVSSDIMLFKVGYPSFGMTYKKPEPVKDLLISRELDRRLAKELL